MKGFKSFLRELRRDIFEAAFDPDICGYATTAELAGEAGLAWTTVDRLYRGQTVEPRMSTIFKLAKAVGMDIQIVKEELAKHS